MSCRRCLRPAKHMSETRRHDENPEAEAGVTVGDWLDFRAAFAVARAYLGESP